MLLSMERVIISQVRLPIMNRHMHEHGSSVIGHIDNGFTPLLYRAGRPQKLVS